MSMNYFAFFPALLNEATNPNAKNTGFFANPAGPDGDQFAALGGQGISIVSYSENQEEAMKFLEWFIKDEHPEALGRAWRLHRQRGRAGKRRVPQRHALQRGLLPDHVQGEGLLGGAGICRTAEPDEPAASIPYVVGGEGTRQGSARRAGGGLERDVQEVRPRRSKRSIATGEGHAAPPAFDLTRLSESALSAAVDDHASTSRSRAAARGMSDLAIRNLFIIPTIALPDRLQHLSADLFAGLFLHRFPRLDQRAGEFRRACRTTATC